MSLLVICEIFGLFVNMLTADDNYSLGNSENFPQPIKMQLYKKQKTLSSFFAVFLHQILNILEKKMTLIAYVFLKLKIAKDMVREMSQKLCFRTPFNSQHAKGTKTLLKSAGEHI